MRILFVFVDLLDILLPKFVSLNRDNCEIIVEKESDQFHRVFLVWHWNELFCDHVTLELIYTISSIDFLLISIKGIRLVKLTHKPCKLTVELILPIFTQLLLLLFHVTI